MTKKIKRKTNQGSKQSAKSNLCVTAAQIDALIGDVKGNTTKIIASALYARDRQKADLIVFPEMALTGYPPKDLLLRPELHQQTQAAIKQIKTRVKDIHILLGLPTQEKDQCFNTALLIFNGKIVASYHKQHLPNYGVFDEKRYFTADNKTCVTTIKGVKVAILVCADLWEKQPVQGAKKAKAQLIININASPFDVTKFHLREQLLKTCAHKYSIPIVYVNSVGGQDELVFDGASMVVNHQGKITQRANFFTEHLMPIEFRTAPRLKPIKRSLATIGSIEEQIYKALVLGVRDYVEKNNFKGAMVSISGGIDSALTLAIAVDAIGKERVEALYMPSRYSSKLSKQLAVKEAELLGVKHSTISIDTVFQTYLDILPKKWWKLPQDVTEENLQARCRSTILMAFSNKKKLLVLATGNKSEMAVGYATLYGDMAGGFSVLKDVPKTLVYRLAKYRNEISKVIPPAVIKRAPTAELAPQQKDTDSLPPYPVLDEILHRYVVLDQSISEIVAAGFVRKTVAKVVRMVNNSEYKRRQSPPGVKITTRSFGERRYPITSGFDR